MVASVSRPRERRRDREISAPVRTPPLITLSGGTQRFEQLPLACEPTAKDPGHVGTVSPFDPLPASIGSVIPVSTVTTMNLPSLVSIGNHTSVPGRIAISKVNKMSIGTSNLRQNVFKLNLHAWEWDPSIGKPHFCYPIEVPESLPQERGRHWRPAARHTRAAAAWLAGTASGR